VERRRSHRGTARAGVAPTSCSHTGGSGRHRLCCPDPRCISSSDFLAPRPGQSASARLSSLSQRAGTRRVSTGPAWILLTLISCVHTLGGTSLVTPGFRGASMHMDLQIIAAGHRGVHVPRAFPCLDPQVCFLTTYAICAHEVADLICVSRKVPACPHCRTSDATRFACLCPLRTRVLGCRRTRPMTRSTQPTTAEFAPRRSVTPMPFPCRKPCSYRRCVTRYVINLRAGFFPLVVAGKPAVVLSIGDTCSRVDQLAQPALCGPELTMRFGNGSR
jgi:hypothetical protein